MAITVHIFYTGTAGSARAFAREMVSSGIVEEIRSRPGNLSYAYYLPMEEGASVLLIDSWENQAALDRHHASPLMGRIAALREKYDLHMQVERFTDAPLPGEDEDFIRR